ncbi:predicted protein [Chaetomium globosum CBS 148.51]|uniref:Uncharacterized protein n=1 Tax=Chaetomium globosum (strain ATCC 6205 / CBS 148.51 / DSM 1962 / NBRC 6347 / NRRL 1970) TaxID=306901 RepID=Q2H0L0_CHAGB|nr:uncharacterized protein CHGG_04686 [Chaetomium globosum CBS 148.51]EAQ88067.1 predicted protein [Chaetomium globosum CBS 148.51]
MTGAPPAAHFPRVGCTLSLHPCFVLFAGIRNGSMDSSPFCWDVGSFDRGGPPPPLDAPAPRPSPGRPPIESACSDVLSAVAAKSEARQPRPFVPKRRPLANRS